MAARYKRYKSRPSRNTDDTNGPNNSGLEPKKMSSPPVSSQRKPRAPSSDERAEGEERYALAMESLGYGVYDWDIEAGTIHHSPELRILLGLSAKDAVKLSTPDSWASLAASRRSSGLPARRHRALQGRDAAARLRIPLPQRRRHRGAGPASTALRNAGPDGRAHRLVGATTDITEIKQRERELVSAKAEAAGTRRSALPPGGHSAPTDARYALALEAINENVYEWDIETDTVYYAPGLRIILGLSHDELRTPQDWIDRIHPDDLPIYQHNLVEHLKGKTPRFICELRYRTGDGNWRWARQAAIALRGPDGRARRMVGAAGDITEKKHRERELQLAMAEAEAARGDLETTRETLRTVLDNMSDGVALVDPDFTLEVRQRALHQLPADSRRDRARRRVRLRHPALPGPARRFRTANRHRKGGAGARGDHADPGRRALRAAHARRPLSRIQLQAARRRQRARDLSRHHRTEGARAGRWPRPRRPRKPRAPTPSTRARSCRPRSTT